MLVLKDMIQRCVILAEVCVSLSDTVGTIPFCCSVPGIFQVPSSYHIHVWNTYVSQFRLLFVIRFVFSWETTERYFLHTFPFMYRYSFYCVIRFAEDGRRGLAGGRNQSRGSDARGVGRDRDTSLSFSDAGQDVFRHHVQLRTRMCVLHNFHCI